MGVIHHVDQCLRALLSGPDGAPAISFDVPTPGWAAEVAPPALNLFLYDVREYVDARAADWEDVRDGAGRVLGRRPPTRHYLLSYLVSAWAKTADEEHRMLGEVLAAIPDRETIPPGALAAPFIEEQRAVQVRIAVPGAGAGAAGWELWSSLGHPPRASLELVVVAPLVAPVDADLAVPPERVNLAVARDGDPAPERRESVRPG